MVIYDNERIFPAVRKQAGNCQALLNKAEILLMDDPASLDMERAREIEKTILV